MKKKLKECKYKDKCTEYKDKDCYTITKCGLKDNNIYNIYRGK